MKISRRRKSAGTNRVNIGLLSRQIRELEPRLGTSLLYLPKVVAFPEFIAVDLSFSFLPSKYNIAPSNGNCSNAATIRQRGEMDLVY